jgi:hypothetical protein
MGRPGRDAGQCRESRGEGLSSVGVTEGAAEVTSADVSRPALRITDPIMRLSGTMLVRVRPDKTAGTRRSPGNDPPLPPVTTGTGGVIIVLSALLAFPASGAK